MRWSRTLAVLPALALQVLAGCATIGLRNAPPNPAIAQRAALVNLPGVRAWADEVPDNPATEFKKRFPTVAARAQATSKNGVRAVVNTLALSGGGGDGAFGAGVLSGWTRHGGRPAFDVVTGVSAGALIAPFAYLGPGYDAPMRDIWTRYSTSQLITAQILPGLLSGASLADTAPMAALIEQYVDTRMLAQVAAEYRKGRLLLVGTTNLDAQRHVVWNMGAIAASGDPAAPELFRKVILASAAIPGAFPPVGIEVQAQGKIYEEMHVDGGTTREVFVTPFEAPLQAFDALYAIAPERRIYIIKNGKLTPEYDPVAAQTIPISVRAITTLIKSQSLSEIYRIWRIAGDAGADFNLTSVPPSFRREAKEAFDKDYQAALFEEGFRVGRSGGDWMKQPPTQRPR